MNRRPSPLADIALCLTFYTRLRLGWPPAHGRSFAEAQWAAPLAGVVVGLCGAFIFWLGFTVGTPSLLTAALTLAAIFIALTGLISGGVFAWLQTQAEALIELGAGTASLFKLLTWIAAILLGSTGFALIMRYGPDRRAAKWRWLAPGALLATLLWLLISFGFSFYVAYVSDYNATYGSLSAVVVFLMWLFLSAYGILAGALMNAEIERQVICDTTVGPDRPRGERGAVLADLCEGSLTMEQWLEKAQRRAVKRHMKKKPRVKDSAATSS